MLKVGRKRNRKERKKEKKHTRSQGNKFRSLNVRINHATHRLKKKHFSRAVTNANKGKKKTLAERHNSWDYYYGERNRSFSRLNERLASQTLIRNPQIE